MAIDFNGRVALVTGAGSGLGRSHARMLASRGARVIVNDLGGSLSGDGASPSAADKVVDEIRAAGGVAAANYDSVTETAGAQRMAQQAIDQFGRLDILINNAGILRDKTFAKMALDDFASVVDVHLMGAARCTHAAWPLMQKAGYGRVVFTLSNSGLYGNFGQSNYGAGKAGLIGLMNVLKLEGAKYNIRVNALAPMAVTRMTEASFDPQVAAKLKPEHSSAAAVYLASEACTESGVIIAAAAGYYARVQVMGSNGVFLDPDREITPDDVAQNFAKISDMSDARAHGSAGAELAYVSDMILGKQR